MSHEVQIHRASEEERLAAYRNVYEFWGGARKQDEFIARRLASAAHNHAVWWVLKVGEEVAASLGAHPLEFSYRGRIVTGFGIAAVHTHPDHRRQGHAAELCREVARNATRQGDKLGLLFSDIDPDYYAELGYQPCAAPRYHCQQLTELAVSGPLANLHPIQPLEDLDRLASWYDNCQRSQTLSIHRSEAYWRYLFEKNGAAEYLTVGWPGAPAEGYVVLHRMVGEDMLEILELIVGDRELEQGTYRAAAQLTLERGCHELGGWLHPARQHLSRFESTPRQKALPMLLALDDEIALDEELLERGCHFWRTDHF